MTFNDLADDWPRVPLTDPEHTNDVLDLFVSMQTRFDSAIFILVCDSQHLPIQPIQIDDITDCEPESLRMPMRQMAECIADARPEATVVLAIARAGSPQFLPIDLAWRDCLVDSFSELLPVIAVHLVTPDGCQLIPAGAAAA